jgi:hypothetical protein
MGRHPDRHRRGGDARAARGSAGRAGKPGADRKLPVVWASDTIRIAHQAFDGLNFQRTQPPPRVQWTVGFDDHTGYRWLADLIKRKQLAKGGARLAEVLNTIWH